MLDSRGKTKGGWFFILGFNMLKPNMSNTISIGTCSSDLYIHYFFETSGTASCGTTGMYIYIYAPYAVKLGIEDICTRLKEEKV